MFKKNSPCNFNGANFNIVKILEHGGMVLKPVGKHLENVKVSKSQLRNVHKGHKK